MGVGVRTWVGLRGALTSALLTAALILPSLPLTASAAPAPDESSVEVYLGGLAFPVAIAFAPDGRAFYSERMTGNIRIIDTTGPTPQLLGLPLDTVPYLATTGEQGLLGMALDPDWATTPWVYVYHSFDNGTVHDNRITRYWAADNRSSMNETIFAGIKDLGWHNSGAMAFGADGKLYVTVGDAYEPWQVNNMSQYHGKVLRLEKDGSVPADNPFPGLYVYTLGHRNMFGIATNPRTGVMYVSENGDHENDEINLLEPGGNYGWPTVNGTVNDARFVDPIWNITPTIAPTGIAFDTSRYNASALVDLYLVDWNTGSLRRFQLAPPNYDRPVTEEVLWSRSVPGATAVAFGPDGRVYVAASDGLYRSDINIVGNRIPTPVIRAGRTTAFVGQNVTYDGTGSYDPKGGGIYAYRWDFGDGTNGSGNYVSYNWTTPGDYTVRLTVTDEYGSTNGTFANITIKDLAQNEAPVPSAWSNRTITYGNWSVAFDASDSFDPEGGGIYNYTWNFSDGVQSLGSWVTRSFAIPGNYTATLSVEDELGAVNSTVRALTVVDIADNTAPTARLAGPDEVLFVGLLEVFSSFGSSDAEGGIYANAWDFGDGQVGNGSFVGHAYSAEGSYPVTLTVYDELGATGSASLQVLVLPASRNHPPAASITPPAGPLLVGKDATFAGNASTDPDGPLVGFYWDFDDGVSGSGPEVVHAFTWPGDHTVSLTVEDRLGATNTKKLQVTVHEGPPPTAEFTMDTWNISAGDGIFFDASASRDGNGWIADAIWDFGDGTSGHGLQVWHYYTEPGRHEVTLTVVNDRGESSSVSTFVEVEGGGPQYGMPVALLVAALVVVVLLRARKP